MDIRAFLKEATEVEIPTPRAPLPEYVPMEDHPDPGFAQLKEIQMRTIEAQISRVCNKLALAGIRPSQERPVIAQRVEDHFAGRKPASGSVLARLGEWETYGEAFQRRVLELQLWKDRAAAALLMPTH